MEENQERLKGLLERTIHAQEDERKRVALELHDGLLQYLIAAEMHLDAYEALLEEGSPDAADLRLGVDRLRLAIAEGRRLISDLRPSTLDDFGLAETVARHLAGLAEETGWQISYEEALGEGSLPPYVETNAFRIVQEALANARRHSGTQRLAVRLSRVDEDLRIRVQDWGHGFDPLARMEQLNGAGVGLLSMKERAGLMGGWWRIEAQPGLGTTIEVGLPLTQDGRADGLRAAQPPDR